MKLPQLPTYNTQQPDPGPMVRVQPAFGDGGFAFRSLDTYNGMAKTVNSALSTATSAETGAASARTLASRAETTAGFALLCAVGAGLVACVACGWCLALNFKLGKLRRTT